MWLTVARTSAIAAAVARQRAAAAGGEHAKHPTDPLLVDVLRVETSIRLLMLTGCRLSEIQKLCDGSMSISTPASSGCGMLTQV